MTSDNPLTRFYRAPKLYVKLPSQGQFYEPDFLDLSMRDEVAVFPLTAIDQILLKTPDALLNGESLLKVIKNCVPGIKDAKQLVEPDINTLMLAIKVASSGNIAEIASTCPNCGAEHEFDVDISHIIESQKFLEDEPTITINDELIIHVRPYDFVQRHLHILNEIEEAQALRVIESNPEMNDTQKVMEVAKFVDSMASRTFDIVAKSITSITIMSTGESVDNPEFISEFLKGISKNQADIIIDKIKELNKIGVDTETTFLCDKCNHEWNQPINFDPTSFFE